MVQLKTKFKCLRSTEAEVLIDLETGEAFTTPNGYACLSTTPLDVVLSDLRFCDELTKITIFTEDGLEEFELIDEDLIAEMIPRHDGQVASRMLKHGIRGTLYELVGYKHKEKTCPDECKKKINFTSHPGLALTIKDNSLFMVVNTMKVGEFWLTPAGYARLTPDKDGLDVLADLKARGNDDLLEIDVEWKGVNYKSVLLHQGYVVENLPKDSPTITACILERSMKQFCTMFFDF